MRRLSFALVAALMLAGLTAGRVGVAALPAPPQEQEGKQKEGKDEPGAKVSGPLGAETNPVRCESPRGERQYLSRLRCPDGKRPEFSRIGSFGVGPYGHILDGYRVKCEGRDEATVFMDMYHAGHVEKEAVPGFTIVEP